MDAKAATRDHALEVWWSTDNQCLSASPSKIRVLISIARGDVSTRFDRSEWPVAEMI